MRGYSIIALDNPKTPANVGSALRAVGIYGASVLFYSGRRLKPGRTDPQKHYRHIPLIRSDNLHSVVPYDCTPIAVDLIKRAIPLPEYKHPERAFYVFGPEDGTLGIKTLSWCKDIIYVPTNGCMNLAAAVNVVLYDRLLKNFLTRNNV